MSTLKKKQTSIWGLNFMYIGVDGGGRGGRVNKVSEMIYVNAPTEVEAFKALCLVFMKKHPDVSFEPCLDNHPTCHPKRVEVHIVEGVHDIEIPNMTLFCKNLEGERDRVAEGLVKNAMPSR